MLPSKFKKKEASQLKMFKSMPVIFFLPQKFIRPTRRRMVGFKTLEN